MENLHSLHSNSIIICDYGFPNAPTDLSISQEYFVLDNLDLNSDSVQEIVLMKTSSSPHYPLRSTSCNALTSKGDTPCSLISSSNEFDFKLTQGSEVTYDEEKGKKLIKCPFHSLSFPILHEENISI